MADWIGKNLGKVHVEKLIARGGMAEVYYGTHTTLHRAVAVKVLLSYLENDPDLKTRFEREARVLANLRHPNIVQIFDFDLVENQPYFVMEYLNGPTLAAHMRAIHTTGGRMSMNQIGRILVMVASALDYAHGQGVIHRDIKPGNIILTSKTMPITPGELLPDDTEAILTDFGLLRLTNSSTHSVSGTVSGTPAYMAPEQARGDRSDRSADLYSLGVVLYEMLAGRVPFEADTSMGVLMKHITQTPARIPRLSSALQNVLTRALAKLPVERYTSARELVGAYLEANNLTITDVAPGYSITPTPGSQNKADSVSLPPDERSTIPPTPTPTTPVVRELRSFLPWLIAIPVALIAFGSMLYALGPFTPLPTATIQPIETSTQAQVSSVTTSTPTIPAQTSAPTMAPMTVDLKSFGLLRFFDVSGVLDEIILTTTSDLAPAPDGSQYEAWLVGGETRRSLGLLKPDATGKAELNFLDDQGRNLLVRYEQLEITLEQNPDPSPNPSGKVVFSSGIPPMALKHIRHLLVAFGDSPNNTGLIIGLMNDATLINTEAAAMIVARDKQDAAGVLEHAEAINNILTGKQGSGYGDLDGNGKINDPGDGYGLLLNGDNLGYIEGTIQHAQLSVNMPDASSNIKVHGGHVIISSKNVEDWGTQLLELIKKLAADPLAKDAAVQVREAASLADRMLNGRDLNGNERIDPVPGEGGAKTVLQHAGYMTDMPILEGANMLPPPAAGAGTVIPLSPEYGPG